MIQFKRGKTSTWEKQKTVLADGQPGYDKERKKLKIGNGKDSWKDLPDASGLFMDEIIDSEENAKNKATGRSAIGNLISNILNIKKENRTIFTYGTAAPDENTVGQVYLQCYDTEPEVDYVVDSGINSGWFYRKWHSGKAECFGKFPAVTSIQMPYEPYKNTLVYHSDILGSYAYPIPFVSAPYEAVTVQSPGPIAWLAGTGTNNEKTSGKYYLLSFDNCDSVEYFITIQACGYWR